MDIRLGLFDFRSYIFQVVILHLEALEFLLVLLLFLLNYPSCHHLFDHRSDPNPVVFTGGLLGSEKLGYFLYLD